MESGGTDSDGDSAYFFRGLTSGTLKRDNPGAFPLKNVLSEAFKEPRLVLIVEYSCFVDPPHHANPEMTYRDDMHMMEKIIERGGK